MFLLAPFATVIGSNSFQDGVNDLIQQARDVQLPFGISLFDVIIVTVVFLILNKILGGKLVDKLKDMLAGNKSADATPKPAAAQETGPVNRPPGRKPGVEDVNTILTDAGVPQSDSDAFVKAQWENIRGVPPKSVKP